MWTYTSEDQTVVTNGEGLFVPCDGGNSDWRDILASGDPIAAYVPPPPSVPVSISPRQLRLALLNIGALDDVEDALATQDRAAQIAWEFSLEYLRSDPLLNSIGAALGFSPEEIDALFVSASQI